jgi:hypothetical protein
MYSSCVTAAFYIQLSNTTKSAFLLTIYFIICILLNIVNICKYSTSVRRDQNTASQHLGDEFYCLSYLYNEQIIIVIPNTTRSKVVTNYVQRTF